MGFTIETGISGVTVFLQGLLSFFSPCVLPLVPLYIGYLAGGAKTVDEDGAIHYRRSKVIVNTLFFVLGVSFAFFLLGFGFTAVGKFFSGNRVLFARIGGVLVILFGVFQLFGSNCFHPRAQIAVPLEPLLYESGGRSDLRIYLQLCLDALRRPSPDQCLADGFLSQFLGGRLRPYWCLHFGLCDPFPRGGAVYRSGIGFL